MTGSKASQHGVNPAIELVGFHDRRLCMALPTLCADHCPQHVYRCFLVLRIFIQFINFFPTTITGDLLVLPYRSRACGKLLLLFLGYRAWLH